MTKTKITEEMRHAAAERLRCPDKPAIHEDQVCLNLISDFMADTLDATWMLPPANVDVETFEALCHLLADYISHE